MADSWTEVTPGRLVYRRFAPGERVVEGIHSFATAQGIRMAMITSAIGSVTRLDLKNLTRADDGSFEQPPQVVEGVMEVLSFEGHIVPQPEGGIRTHVHVGASHPSGETIAGHLDEATVATSAYVFLQVLEEEDSEPRR